MYEFYMPHLSKEQVSWYNIFTAEEARAPLMAMIICATIFYQLYVKKAGGLIAWITGRKEAVEPERPMYDKDDPRYEMERFREKARRSGKLTPKLEASMAGLEQMLEGVHDMG